MAKTKISYFPVDQAKALVYLDEKMVRKMYTQYRDIAQKRLNRIAKEGFGWTSTYKEHAEGFRKLRGIDKRDLAKAFSELSRFVSAKLSTVTGQRARMEKTIKKWNEHDIPLNEQNYRAVMEIMEELRDRKLIYGSDDITDVANKMLAFGDDIKNALLDDIDKVMENIDTFMNIEIPEGKSISATEILSKLG